jgi:hypothetical protein
MEVRVLAVKISTDVLQIFFILERLHNVNRTKASKKLRKRSSISHFWHRSSKSAASFQFFQFLSEANSFSDLLVFIYITGEKTQSACCCCDESPISPPDVNLDVQYIF